MQEKERKRQGGSEREGQKKLNGGEQAAKATWGKVYQLGTGSVHRRQVRTVKWLLSTNERRRVPGTTPVHPVIVH